MKTILANTDARFHFPFIYNEFANHTFVQPNLRKISKFMYLRSSLVLCDFHLSLALPQETNIHTDTSGSTKDWWTLFYNLFFSVCFFFICDWSIHFAHIEARVSHTTTEPSSTNTKYSFMLITCCYEIDVVVLFFSLSRSLKLIISNPQLCFWCVFEALNSSFGVFVAFSIRNVCNVQSILTKTNGSNKKESLYQWSGAEPNRIPKTVRNYMRRDSEQFNKRKKWKKIITKYSLITVQYATPFHYHSGKLFAYNDLGQFHFIALLHFICWKSKCTKLKWATLYYLEIIIIEITVA